MIAPVGRLGALLLTVALGAAACGGGGPVAATVNGEQIPASAVDRDLAAIAGNKPFLEARDRQGLPFRGTKPGTYDAATVAELLNRKVTALLVHQELGRRALAAPPTDLASARERLLRQEVDPASGASLLAGFPSRYVDEQARVLAESDLLQAAEGGVALDDRSLRMAYGADQDRYRVWCVRWILYGPADPDGAVRSAAAASAAIAAGEPFEQRATRESTDAGSAGRGGALGCQTREGLARLGDAVRDAAVALAPGQVSAPTTSEVGTFLVQVTDVKVRPFEEVRSNVRAQTLLPARDRYEHLLRRLRGDARVVVAARFGSWDRADPDAISLLPPGARPKAPARAPAPASGPGGP